MVAETDCEPNRTGFFSLTVVLLPSLLLELDQQAQEVSILPESLALIFVRSMVCCYVTGV